MKFDGNKRDGGLVPVAVWWWVVLSQSELVKYWTGELNA